MKLELKNISQSFLGRTIFEGVNLTIRDSEIIALVGPSGSGKTTILQIAAGLSEPGKGQVVRHYHRHAIVFQDPRLLPWYKLCDNIAYGVQNKNRRQKYMIAENEAYKVGLGFHDLEKYPVELSGGMRQRAAVARAFAVRPDFMFFDEPFSAVDVGLRRVLQDLVIKVAAEDGFSALLVTHDLAEAARMANRLFVLSNNPGRIVEELIIPGVPGSRSDREIFNMIETWSSKPTFSELFDGERGRGMGDYHG